MSKRIVFHIDVNSAFLSWTATQMVNEGKNDIRLVPSVISGDPNKRTSVVLAKSIPAKKYKINTGEPISMALRKCSDLVIAPPDFKLYYKFSKAFKGICREYTPVVQEFSIDECFLDMSGMENIYPDIIATAYEIKDKIKHELGFTVNVGVGSNKLLAKMASDFEKPDKVHTLFDYEIEQKMWVLPIRDLLFLGKATAEKLNNIGIKTIGELAHTDIATLKSLVGNKASEQLYNHANGIDDDPVDDSPREVKSYSHSITVEEDITDIKTANQLLLSLTDAAASRMRADNAKAHCVCVNIRDNHHKDKSHQRQFDNPTDITSVIYTTAKELLLEVWNGKTPLRLIGVNLTDLTKDGSEQLSLFGTDNSTNEKKQKIDSAIDAIRNKYGDSKITLGSIMNTKRPKKK
ncbi:MAG: DNA polymerase IV [Acetobacter sp.]|nr:DNA polymerase IV [Bacteroides sp.]MCM1340830.1 DNA polymerase IV [Acetobacter sp.]MCM1432613.1 DNA polymerase IV [Clostridiales bacterium]